LAGNRTTEAAGELEDDIDLGEDTFADPVGEIEAPNG